MPKLHFDYDKYVRENEIRMRLEVIKFNRDELRKVWEGKNSSLSFDEWLAEMDRTLPELEPGMKR